jgi:hypothetical protein
MAIQIVKEFHETVLDTPVLSVIGVRGGYSSAQLNLPVFSIVGVGVTGAIIGGLFNSFLRFGCAYALAYGVRGCAFWSAYPALIPQRDFSSKSAPRERTGLQLCRAFGALSLDSPGRAHEIRFSRRGMPRLYVEIILAGDSHSRGRLCHTCLAESADIAVSGNPCH